MFRWLQGPGQNFYEPLPGSTNYLSAYDVSGRLIRTRDYDRPEGGADVSRSSELPKETSNDLRPFPLNNAFRSHRILSDELREEIYRRVAVVGKSVKVVSAELGVEMNRVGAVVRLKTIEKDWEKKGKKFPKPYARAVLSMLPQTPFNPDSPMSHESINDLPAHPATMQQIFYPTSESRHFTRADAGKVFDPTLLPADDRIPHPELITLERERLEGVPRAERIARQRERLRLEVAQKTERERLRAENEAREVKAVTPPGARWEFRFREISVQDVGKDGRAPGGVGWRYGIPHEDRKKGQVKIPTRVA
ncbi:MAG: hypothetical protein M1819_004485 [Sarea resinae]|nr:MAG: hypothetical protein M1819_004485 [Sarea resinae]